MARMFYTLAEAAEKLGVDEDQIKQIASDGKLQQFRDGNRLMFKRDQVETLAHDSAADQAEPSLEESGGPIPLDPRGDTDQIDLAEASRTDDHSEDPQQASGTGVSVFNTDEIDEADPMAQTQVTKQGADEEDLTLENVGSGSGLLDLTQENDDTSLGAELLEEIYPDDEGSDTKIAVPSSDSGAFATGVELETAGSTGAGIRATDPGAAPVPGTVAPLAVAESHDSAGNGFSIGMLLGTTITLVLATIVSVAALFGTPSGVTSTLTANTSSLWMYSGILLGGSIVFGVIGMFLSRGLQR